MGITGRFNRLYSSNHNTIRHKLGLDTTNSIIELVSTTCMNKYFAQIPSFQESMFPWQYAMRSALHLCTKHLQAGGHRWLQVVTDGYKWQWVWAVSPDVSLYSNWTCHATQFLQLLQLFLFSRACLKTQLLQTYCVAEVIGIPHILQFSGRSIDKSQEKKRWNSWASLSITLSNWNLGYFHLLHKKNTTCGW